MANAWEKIDRHRLDEIVADQHADLAVARVEMYRVIDEMCEGFPVPAATRLAYYRKADAAFDAAVAASDLHVEVIRRKVEGVGVH